MIQIFEVTAPLPPGTKGADAQAVLTTANSHIMRAFPALRNAVVETSQGAVTLRLTVSGRDRWNTKHRARLIATSMLQKRLGVDPATATLRLVGTAPNATMLTKEQGRNTENYRRRVQSRATPEDPS